MLNMEKKMFQYHQFCSLDSQQSVDDRVDRGGELAEDGGHHVQVSGDQGGVAQLGQQEHLRTPLQMSTGCPKKENFLFKWP